MNFVYNNIDLPLIDVLSTMEKNGIKVNINYLKELRYQFEKDSNNIAKKIFKLSNAISDNNALSESFKIIWELPKYRKSVPKARKIEPEIKTIFIFLVSR